MQISFHGFGATRVLSGYTLEVVGNLSVATVRSLLINRIQSQKEYSELVSVLSTTAFAREDKVLNDSDIINEGMTIYLLPPVCGG